MTTTNSIPTSTRTVRRGRIFPEIQWSPEKIAQWKAQQEAIHQRCKLVFDRLKPELIETHYNWYIAIDPETGDYAIDRDIEVATQMSRQKHPEGIPFLFRINQSGVCGTI
ncbi:MAG TPA: hypothetical protein DEG17_23380 [Cyanobacteria bacterium UBA11149]|nr:hypothetical protein [Cyanobacteria bacterium UBA11367]HBE56191.1 hypothetical protein [Cyanobacteria bacterium UBA11366]HBK62139.1 hypothetical protein [Cyanobacteria bacterium UBA11166]HBR75279.1 hypothetical protein [Cyanobacteria bacterium UBA11159]HBS68787.1 hypothetical protein [Cyanobacteria bacterium UBA11153]HBW91724.1 hypothetical protein [Cyanobacteria bacterium UBA11149]